MDGRMTCPYCGAEVDEGEYHPCGPVMGRIRRRLAEGPASVLEISADVDASPDEVRSALEELKQAGMGFEYVEWRELYPQPEEIGR